MDEKIYSEKEMRVLIGIAFQASSAAAFRACRSEESGYKDENSRLVRRVENEMRSAVAVAIRRMTPEKAKAELSRYIEIQVESALAEAREQS